MGENGIVFRGTLAELRSIDGNEDLNRYPCVTCSDARFRYGIAANDPSIPSQIPAGSPSPSAQPTTTNPSPSAVPTAASPPPGTTGPSQPSATVTAKPAVSPGPPQNIPVQPTAAVFPVTRQDG